MHILYIWICLTALTTLVAIQHPIDATTLAKVDSSARNQVKGKRLTWTHEYFHLNCDYSLAISGVYLCTCDNQASKITKFQDEMANRTEKMPYEEEECYTEEN